MAESPPTAAVTDPTELTRKAVDALRKELTDLFEARIEALTDLTAERFQGVAEKLDVAEKLRTEQKTDTKTAVDAALDAAREAVNQQAAAFATATDKTERNFTEQLKGIRDTFGTAIAAQATRYDDLKEIVTGIRENKVGAQESKTGMYAAAGFGIAVLLAFLAVFGFIAANGGTP